MKSHTLLILLALLAPACVLAAGAAIGAGAVHATGEDSVEIYLESSYDAALAATRAELQARGVIKEESPGHFKAEVGGSTVEATLAPSGDQVHLKVKARKNIGISPDPATAELVAQSVHARVKA